MHDLFDPPLHSSTATIQQYGAYANEAFLFVPGRFGKPAQRNGFGNSTRA